MDPVPEPRLDQPRREPHPGDHRDPTGRGRSRSNALPPSQHVRRPHPTRSDPSRIGRGDADHVHQRGHPLVGRLADLRQRSADPGPTTQRGRRQTPPSRRRHTPTRSQGRRRNRIRSQLVGRSRHVAQPLLPRAQRNLRPPQRALPGMGRRTALQRGSARQRRSHGQDPLHRVDPGDPPELPPRLGSQLQLVRHAHVQVPQVQGPQGGSRFQSEQSGARRPGRQQHSTSTAHRSDSQKSSSRSTACTRSCPNLSACAPTPPATSSKSCRSWPACKRDRRKSPSGSG